MLKPESNSTSEARIDFPESLDGVDIKAGLKMMGGNASRYKNLMIGFRNKYIHIGHDLGLALERGDFTEIKRVAHTLKGLAGMAGFTGLPLICQDLETAAKSAIAGPCQEQLKRLGATCDILMRSIAGLGSEVLPEASQPWKEPDGKQTILIVDDERLNIDILGNELHGTYRILTAESGPQALKMLGENVVDLIILDIMMPVMDGLETCRRLKIAPNTRDIPVIFISACQDDEDEEYGLRLGAIDYIKKPFYLPIVKARIKTHLNQKLLEHKLLTYNRQLIDAQDAINQEKNKYHQLLSCILPESIARELMLNREVAPRSYDMVTVMFTDFIDFTRLTALIDPVLLIRELNDIFCAFDSIMEKNHCERIKTIGDGYLAVCGLPDPCPEHAERIVDAAVDCINYLKIRNSQLLGKTLDIQWEIRIGINTGPVVAGVVGSSRYIYDIFGDTVNTSSRIEGQSPSQGMAFSDATRKLLGAAYPCKTLGIRSIKGKGDIELFALDPQGVNPDFDGGLEEVFSESGPL